MRVPTVEHDDARRGLREHQRLVKERTAHTNRIKGLLKTQGIMNFDPRAEDAIKRLDDLRTGDGRLAADVSRRNDAPTIMIGISRRIVPELASCALLTSEAPIKVRVRTGFP